MNVDNQLHEISIRVSVLEQKNSALENRMDALKKEFDNSRDEHIRTHDKFQVRLSVIEQVVDDQKLNIELAKKSLVALEKATAQIEKLNDKMDEHRDTLSAIQTKQSRIEGVGAGIVLIGGAAWAVLTTFKDQILAFFGA